MKMIILILRNFPGQEIFKMIQLEGNNFLLISILVTSIIFIFPINSVLRNIDICRCYLFHFFIFQ